MDEVRKLTADNAKQQHSLDLLELLIAAKLASFGSALRFGGKRV